MPPNGTLRFATQKNQSILYDDDFSDSTYEVVDGRHIVVGISIADSILLPRLFLLWLVLVVVVVVVLLLRLVDLETTTPPDDDEISD